MFLSLLAITHLSKNRRHSKRIICTKLCVTSHRARRHLRSLGKLSSCACNIVSYQCTIGFLSSHKAYYTLVQAASFHHLTVEDEIDRLRIRFGPLPLFQRTILYENMLSVEVDRTTILEGWGIHLSPRGGWVWNLWGRDCIVLKLKKGTLRVGTDDVENLAAFVKSRISLNEDQ